MSNTQGQFNQPAQPPQQFNQPPLGHLVYQPPRTNGMAIASLVMGLCGFITGGFTSLLGVFFGHIALKQIRREHTDGKSMAIWGLITSYLLTLGWLVIWLLIIGLFGAWVGSTAVIMEEMSTANPSTCQYDEKSGELKGC